MVVVHAFQVDVRQYRSHPQGILKFLKASQKSASYFARIFLSFWISAGFAGISARPSEHADGWREFRTVMGLRPRQRPLRHRRRPGRLIVVKMAGLRRAAPLPAQAAALQQPVARAPEPRVRLVVAAHPPVAQRAPGATVRKANPGTRLVVAQVQALVVVQARALVVVQEQADAATDIKFSGLCRSNLARFPWRKPGEMPC